MSWEPAEEAERERLAALAEMERARSEVIAETADALADLEAMATAVQACLGKLEALDALHPDWLLAGVESRRGTALLTARAAHVAALAARLASGLARVVAAATREQLEADSGAPSRRATGEAVGDAAAGGGESA